MGVVIKAFKNGLVYAVFSPWLQIAVKLAERHIHPPFLREVFRSNENSRKDGIVERLQVKFFRSEGERPLQHGLTEGKDLNPLFGPQPIERLFKVIQVALYKHLKLFEHASGCLVIDVSDVACDSCPL